MNRLFQIISPLAFTTLAFGCGLGGSDSGGSPVAEEDFPSALAEAYCSLVHVDCACTDPDDADEATCVTNQTSSNQSDMAEAQAAGLTYDAACAGNSVAQWNSWGCKPLSELSSGDDCSSWCGIYTGTVAAGGACANTGAGSDCAQGLVCWNDTCQAACDVFGSSDMLGEGEACEIEGVQCDYGQNLFCSQMSMTCEVAPGIGEACPDYVCADAACDETMMCVALPGVGEPCPAFQCVSGAQCDSGSMMCVAEEAFVCL